MSSEVVYYIDKDTGTTTCEIINTKYFFLDFVHFNFSITTMQFFQGPYLKRLYMPEKFVGKAICSPDDKFDTEYGKRLAYSRAKRNMIRSFFKRANYFANHLDDTISNMVDKFNTYGSKLARNTKRRADWLERNVQ